MRFRGCLLGLVFVAGTLSYPSRSLANSFEITEANIKSVHYIGGSLDLACFAPSSIGRLSAKAVSPGVIFTSINVARKIRALRKKIRPLTILFKHCSGPSAHCRLISKQRRAARGKVLELKEASKECLAFFDGSTHASSSRASSGGSDGSQSSMSSSQDPSSSSRSNSLSSAGSSSSGAGSLSMTAASRLNGVAPLAVFFDAVDTTDPAWNSGVIQPADGDYASFDYQWDFGDSGAGRWTTGRQNPDGSYPSKNTAAGYLAAHVFETPGIYTVALSVTDADGENHHYHEVITVDDPDIVFAGIKTRCVSVTGDFTGCPASSSQAASSDLLAQIDWLNQSSGRRLLLSRGDTWTISEVAKLSVEGPGMIGAYGTGDKPIIEMTANGMLWCNNRRDWRIMDLTLQQEPSALDTILADVGDNGLITHCALSGFGSMAIYEGAVENVVISDLELVDLPSYGMYLAYSGRHTAVMGSHFDHLVPPSSEHLIRTYHSKLLIAHNKFERGAVSKLQIKMCAPTEAEDPLGARYNIVSDNIFTNPGPVGWLTSFGPENTEPVSRELLEHVVVESNIWDLPLETEGLAAITSSGANDITIRNNIFNNIGTPILVSHVVPNFSTYINWKIYNNTFSRAKNPDIDAPYFILVDAVPDASLNNWVVKNNVVYMPHAVADHWGAPRIIVAPAISLSKFSVDYNDWYMPLEAVKFDIGGESYGLTAWQTAGQDLHSLSLDPQLIDPVGGNFHLHPDSPAIDAGTPLSAFMDYDQKPRPANGQWDMGAYEYAP